jgi:23S rRNA pseudouridine2605 synthase
VELSFNSSTSFAPLSRADTGRIVAAPSPLGTPATCMPRPRKPAPALQRRTLDRLLSRAGFCSRAQARELVAAGRVAVNGSVARSAEQWIDPAREAVTVDGAPLQAAAPRVLLLHKPKDCVTTRSDERGRRTIYDLLGAAAQGPAVRGAAGWLAPVGRLDRDTSGLLLLTNDHDLADALTDPARHVPKTYLVKAATRLDEEQLAALARGVRLEDGPTRPALVRRVRDTARRTLLELQITEGRNRQVRRMLEAVGSGVLELRRTALGPLVLDVPAGRWRELGAEEVGALRRSAGLARRGPAS